MDEYSSILDCNKYAIEALKDKNFSIALELLRKAKSLLRSCGKSEKTMQLKAITYNNLGCFYKQQKNLKKSLIYLMQAMSYELHLPRETAKIEGTFLNISKIYSELGDHEKSLNFALKAVKCIEDDFEEKKTVALSLVIAYQQAGNEYFYLGLKSEGKMFVAQGYEVALKYFGIAADITKELEKNLKKLKKEERNNPVIDKMLNYFERHVGYTEKISKNPIVTKSSDKALKSHRKIKSLQPITNISIKKQPSRMCFSKSPAKVTKNSPIIPKLKKFIPEKSSTEKMQKFNRNLSMFKRPQVQKIAMTKKPAKKKKSFLECCIIIQKWIKGWIARKQVKKKLILIKAVQKKVRNYLKKLNIFEKNSIYQQFFPDY